MKSKSLFLTFLLLLSMLSTAWADEIITIVADGQTISDATTWENSTVNITGSGKVTFSKRITISGDVTLNLGAGATLTASFGITVNEGNSLTIAGDGTLNAGANNMFAAIGGTFRQNSGTINITGGTINATGKNGGAGIGGGDSGSATIINISGGNVTATGDSWSAGIGGGYKGNAGMITITGGVVSATGNYKGAGIGGGGDSENPGDGGTITISGGQVNATGGKDNGNPCGYGIGPGKGSSIDGTLGTISLSWTESTDFINASSYKGTISFEDGKRFYYDGTTDYVTADELANKLNQKIVPAVADNNSLAYADIQMPLYYITTNGTAVDVSYDVYDYNGNKLTLGTHYTAVIKNSSNEEVSTFDQLGDYTLTVTGTGTTYTGSKSVTFSLVEWDANLSVDGSDHYINFPNDGTKKTVYLGKDQTIKVYDSEGKNGNLVPSDGRLMLYAPEGYTLEVTGKTDAQFYASGEYLTWLKAYDGNDETETALITKIDQNSENILFASAADGMLMRFYVYNGQSAKEKYGLDLTVRVVEATPHNITVGTADNGSIASDKTSAKTNETVTLTVNPADGYLLKRIIVTDTDNGTTLSTIGEDHWYSGSNTVTFKVPNKNVTITPEFTNDLTASGLSTISISPDGVKECVIPEGVTSFNIGGSPVKNGASTTVLQVPNGYRLLAAGNVKFYGNSYDDSELCIYDGADISATLLKKKIGYITYNNGNPDIGTQISSSNYMTIYLYEQDIYNVSFTGKINMVYSIDYDLAGGSVAIENPATYTYDTDTFTLTNPSKTGYKFVGWSGTDLDAANTSVTIAKGSYGNRTYTATWKKPLTNSDITIAAIPDQTYTGLAIEPEVTVTDGETPLTLGTDYTVSYSANINVGTATATITGIGDYSGTVEKEFAITKAPLTITAKNKTIAYGDEPANDGVEYSGFVNGETESVLNGELSYSYDYAKLDNVGTYAITPSGLTADNYDISFASGTLTVEPKKTDFAAVQILEDENGARAIIDGDYTADNAAVNIPENIEVASVEFTRSFTPEVFATVTFPFEVNTSCLTGVDSIIEFQGITADYEVDFGVIWKKTENGEQTHITLQPYHPYMISMNSTKLGINCQDQEHTSLTLKATSEEAAEDIVQRYGNWIFTGTLAYKQWQAGDPDLTPTRVVYGYAAEADGKYGVGAFVRIGSDASISPFRAYIKYSPLPQMSNKPAPAPAGVMMANSAVSGNATAGIDNLPESMDVVIVSKDENGNEHTTVIGSINTRTGEIRFNRHTADRWFDMQGRVLQGKPSVKGRYLHNGKVEIVK